MDEPTHPFESGKVAAPTELGTEPAENETVRRAAVSRALKTLLVLGALTLIAGLLAVVTDAGALAAFGAVVIGALIMRVGWFFLQQFATPPPPPPDPGTMRKVKLVYRCEICGTEVRMTSAVSEDPEPPRHCMEDMELVSSQE